MTMHVPHIHGSTLTDSMEKGRVEREAAGAALRADVEARDPGTSSEEFPSAGFTGRTMGWTVAEYSIGHKWRWWARFNSKPGAVAKVITGHADTWAEAIHDAKQAYEELEATS